MKKKIYTAPTLSVEEFTMSEVICTSSKNVRGIESDGVVDYGGSSANDQNESNGGNPLARGKGRGIWDED